MESADPATGEKKCDVYGHSRKYHDAILYGPRRSKVPLPVGYVGMKNYLQSKF